MQVPGVTRSAVKADHAFIAPDSHVKSVLPGWKDTMGIIQISPQMGARFCQYQALMEKGGTAGAPQHGVQRFIYVLEGRVKVSAGDRREELGPGGYAYFPAEQAHDIKATKASRLVVFEKYYSEEAHSRAPRVVIGQEQDVKSAPFLGDKDAQLKLLLPETPEFDMAINIFAFNPGTTLPFVEVHVMEHGLMLIDGEGVYRLSDCWYIIRKEDVIWMAPYCPQWFVASGKSPSRYIYYKDVQRDPMQADA